MIYEQHKTKIHSILFIFTLILSIIFAWDYKTVDAEKIDKMEAWTWLQSFTWNTTLSWAKEHWNNDKSKDLKKSSKEQIYKNKSNWWGNAWPCDKDCKIKQLEHAWINPDIAYHLVNECKKQDKEVVNCIKLGASILWAESSWGYNCYKFKCFWVQWVTFNSFEESARDFALRWSKHWYNQKKPSSFYSSKAWVFPKTHFCLSEVSSGSNTHCPNGAKHAWSVFNKLNF